MNEVITSLKRNSLSLLIVLGMLAAFSASPVIAEEGPVSVPGGPYLHPDAQVGRQSILNFEEVEQELFRLQGISRGAMDLRVVGYSGEGRPLYAAVIGDGDTRMWIQGRIHGNEPYGAEACLDVLTTLVAGGEPAEEVLSEITFMIIPIYNPDGSEIYWRGDHTGMDLNRDWNISYEDWLRTRELVQDGEGFLAFAWDWFTRFKAVESESFFDAWYDFKPHYAIDIHHQGTYYVDDTDEMTTFSIGIPVNPAHLRDEIWDASRQMAVVT
ncbi:MAG: M14 family zinc carboxypeptidase, partial [Dehalococcoidia bacterium]